MRATPRRCAPSRCWLASSAVAEVLESDDALTVGVLLDRPVAPGETAKRMWGLDEQRSLIASGHCQAYGDSAAAHPGNKGEQDDCEHGRDPPSERGSKYNPRAARAPMTYELFLIGRLASITNDRHGREEEKNPARMGGRLEAVRRELP